MNRGLPKTRGSLIRDAIERWRAATISLREAPIGSRLCGKSCLPTRVGRPQDRTECLRIPEPVVPEEKENAMSVAAAHKLLFGRLYHSIWNERRLEYIEQVFADTHAL